MPKACVQGFVFCEWFLRPCFSLSDIPNLKTFFLLGSSKLKEQDPCILPLQTMKVTTANNRSETWCMRVDATRRENPAVIDLSSPKNIRQSEADEATAQHVAKALQERDQQHKQEMAILMQVMEDEHAAELRKMQGASAKLSGQIDGQTGEMQIAGHGM
jgi:hypothetical protein